MSVTLVLPVPPSANRYFRIFRGRAVKSKEARDYRLQVASAWARLPTRPAMLTGAVHVAFRWYRPAKRGDLDNVQKVCLDVLQGLAYRNDQQITRLLAERFEDPLNPRLEVEINAA